MIFKQVFDTNTSTYTYLIASAKGREAVIIDPVIEYVDEYIKFLKELDLKLVKVIDTHIHADHISGIAELRDKTNCVTVMGDKTPADVVAMKVSDEEIIKIDGINFSKKDYYLGLRPEHLSVSENSEYKFNPKVDLIENLGNEKIAYIKMDQYEISAKIPSHHTIENSIGFNSKDIFVFDENGNRVKS